jgi:hypothetical protein
LPRTDRDIGVDDYEHKLFSEQTEHKKTFVTGEDEIGWNEVSDRVSG